MLTFYQLRNALVEWDVGDPYCVDEATILKYLPPLFRITVNKLNFHEIKPFRLDNFVTNLGRVVLIVR